MFLVMSVEPPRGMKEILSSTFSFEKVLGADVADVAFSNF
jgi:hypothetical protein